MATRLVRLLEVASADPQQPIGRLELLAPEERRQILVDWNDTACEVPPATLPGLFEAQVKRSPAATALVFGESTLTYAQLNARTNRLAHLLIGLGIGPEDLVALVLPRSGEMIVGLLAILKAGAAYLPLDPDQPAERLAYMLQDAQPACVLTSAQMAELLPNDYCSGSSRSARHFEPSSSQQPQILTQPTPSAVHRSNPATRPTSSIPLAPPESPKALWLPTEGFPVLLQPRSSSLLLPPKLVFCSLPL